MDVHKRNKGLSLLCVLLAVLMVFMLLPPVTCAKSVGEASESTIILSPDHYFGDMDRMEKEKNSTILYFDGFHSNPKTQMQEYVEAFKAAGFTGFLVARSNGDREAVMKFDGIDCVWLLWDKSEQCVRLEMLNSLPSDDDIDADESLPDRMDRWLGTPKNVEYNSDEEYLIYDFSYSSYPASKVNSFLKELQALGFSAGDLSAISSGTSLQKVYWNDETCLLIWWLPKTNKLEITIYRDVAEDAGAFREVDIPKPTEPEPKPGESEPTIPSTDSPNAVSNIVRNIFGIPFKMVYQEDRYETRMYFRSAAEPKSAFSSFQLKMESFGLRVKGSNFSGSKEVGAKAEGGTPVMASWKKKSDEIEVTIKWEYVLKAGVFDTGDVPKRTPQDPKPSPDKDKVRCNVCFGYDKCPECGGSGETEKSLHGKPYVKVTQICNRCWGTKTCDSCDKGWVDP